jgi:hypothetical protein
MLCAKPDPSLMCLPSPADTITDDWAFVYILTRPRAYAPSFLFPQNYINYRTGGSIDRELE